MVYVYYLTTNKYGQILVLTSIVKCWPMWCAQTTAGLLSMEIKVGVFILSPKALCMWCQCYWSSLINTFSERLITNMQISKHTCLHICVFERACSKQRDKYHEWENIPSNSCRPLSVTLTILFISTHHHDRSVDLALLSRRNMSVHSTSM